MVIPAAAIAAVAAVEAAEVLRAGGEVALGGGAQYIRDGQPIGVVAQVGHELARLACRRYGNNPSQYPADTALNYEKACRPYLDDIGEGSGPTIGKPYEGGNCPGVNYIATWEQRRFVSGSGYQWISQGPSQTLPGPVSVTAGADNGSLPCGQGENYAQWQVAGVNNTNPTSLVAGCIDGGKGWRNLVLTPQGGTCPNPNPPPEVTDPKPPGFTLPPIVPIIISPEVNIDADVQVNVDGTVDIDIGTGPITIDPFGGDGDGGSQGGGGPDDSPPNPEPGPDLPGGNGGFGGDDMFGEPPAGRRWVGCCITITQRPANQPPIPNSVPEDVYASVVGNIRLVYSASGTRQTDTPVRIQAKKVCVWEAVRKLNPVGVSVDLQAGFGYSYRPYSVPLDA